MLVIPRAGHPERVADRDRAALTLTLSGSEAQIPVGGITCAANASLISTRSMSAEVRPARAIAIRDASTGP